MTVLDGQATLVEWAFTQGFGRTYTYTVRDSAGDLVEWAGLDVESKFISRSGAELTGFDVDTPEDGTLIVSMSDERTETLGRGTWTGRVMFTPSSVGATSFGLEGPLTITRRKSGRQLARTQSASITLTTANDGTIVISSGAAATIGIGDVETLPAGAEATAEIAGSAPAQVLNLGIPTGLLPPGAVDPFKFLVSDPSGAEWRALPTLTVYPSGDITGAVDNASVAAAVAALDAAGGGHLQFAAGAFYVTDTIDLSNLYNVVVSGSGHGGNPDDVSPNGSQIRMVSSNIPILVVTGLPIVRDLCLIYETQQTTADTDAIGISLNNVVGGSYENVRVWNAHTSWGLPQSAFGATAYNVVFNSRFSNVHSYRASHTHYDLRNYNGAGTNCQFGPLYINGGGSLDFVTTGQTALYGIRLASTSGFEFGAVSIDGVQITERVIDVAAGSNLVSFDTLRLEAVTVTKDGDGWIGLGGGDNCASFTSVELKNCRWIPASASATYLFRTNATRNILDVLVVRVGADCAFGSSGVRRCLLNAAAEAGSAINVHHIYDAAPSFSDVLWGDSISTLQTPVRFWNGSFVNGVRRAGRSSNTHRSVVGTAVPTTGTWEADDELIMDAIVHGQATAFRCVTAGTPGTWKSIAQTVKADTKGNRPAPSASEPGLLYLDTTYAPSGMPMWWNGTAWVDASGDPVGAVTLTALANAASVTASSSEPAANNTSGALTVTAVASPAAGALCQVGYSAAFTNRPRVVICPANAAAAAAGLYVSANFTSTFSVSAVNAPSSGATLMFTYIVKPALV